MIKLDSSFNRYFQLPTNNKEIFITLIFYSPSEKQILAGHAF